MLAVLVALAVAVAVVLVAGLAIADAAPSATAPAPGFPGSRPAAVFRLPGAPSATGYHEPQARPGAGRSGGVRKAGSASRSSASSGAAAAASLLVSGGRFHLHSSSFSTDV